LDSQHLRNIQLTFTREDGSVKKIRGRNRRLFIRELDPSANEIRLEIEAKTRPWSYWFIRSNWSNKRQSRDSSSAIATFRYYKLYWYTVHNNNTYIHTEYIKRKTWILREYYSRGTPKQSQPPYM
jgi:hypothetical protein